MAQNVTIAGNQYPSVPSILIPKTGGGGNATFTDTSPTTAIASDVAQGKIFFDSTGTQQTGTASGGSAVIQSLSVTQNGTYTAPTGVDGYSPVTVSVSGGGGGGGEYLSILSRTISGAYENSQITSLGTFAFAYCSDMTAISLPELSQLGVHAFSYCTKLSTVYMPKCENIGSYAFRDCSSLTTMSFPMVSIISPSAFLNCKGLTHVDMPSVVTIGTQAFAYCSNITTVSFPMARALHSSCFGSCSALAAISLPSLTTVSSGVFRYAIALESMYLFNTSVATGGSNMLANTPMSLSSYLGHFGSIYVRSSLLSAWKSKAHWSLYASRMVGLTDEQIAALG